MGVGSPRPGSRGSSTRAVAPVHTVPAVPVLLRAWHVCLRKDPDVWPAAEVEGREEGDQPHHFMNGSVTSKSMSRQFSLRRRLNI